jgi:hypothetical protein
MANAANYEYLVVDVLGVGKSCFPSTARVLTATRGQRQLQELVQGELVATAHSAADASKREIYFERFLGDLHSELEHTLAGQFLMLEHESGSLHVSASHFVETVEHGFVPAGHIRVGDHVFVSEANHRLVKMSLVQSIRNVSMIGLYAPLTFSGSLLVDGVVVSSYTMDEANAFLQPDALRRLIELVGGYNGLNTIMHMLSLPLRLAYRVGLPQLFGSAVSMGFPGFDFLHAFLVPDQHNAGVSKSGDGLPLYVEHIGRLTGFLLNTFLSGSSC